MSQPLQEKVMTDTGPSIAIKQRGGCWKIADPWGDETIPFPQATRNDVRTRMRERIMLNDGEVVGEFASGKFDAGVCDGV